MNEYKPDEKEHIPVDCNLLLSDGHDYWVGKFNAIEFIAERAIDRYRIVKKWLRFN